VRACACCVCVSAPYVCVCMYACICVCVCVCMCVGVCMCVRACTFMCDRKKCLCRAVIATIRATLVNKKGTLGSFCTHVCLCSCIAIALAAIGTAKHMAVLSLKGRPGLNPRHIWTEVAAQPTK